MNETKKGRTSFADYAPEELKELSRKGGLRSGESRQKRMKLREELEALLSSGDVQERLCAALILKAQGGNVYAFQTLRDTLGEKPRDEIEIAGDFEAYRQRHLKQIKALYLDEIRREEPLYGDLAKSLLTYEETRELWELMKAQERKE